MNTAMTRKEFEEFVETIWDKELRKAMKIHPLVKIFLHCQEAKKLAGNSLEKKAHYEKLIKDKACAPYLKEIVDILYNPFRLFHYCPPVGKQIALDQELPDRKIEEIWDVFLDILRKLGSLNRSDESDRVWSYFLDVLYFLDVYCPRGLQYWFALLVNKKDRDFFGWHQWDKYGFDIPHFDVQLCDTYSEEKLKNMTFPWFAEPKLDGLTMVTLNGVAYSRNGKPMNNVDHILKEVKRLGLEKYALHGEAFGLDWNLSLSITKSQKPHKKAKKLEFHVWDMIPAKEWEAGKCKDNLSLRKLQMGHRIPKRGIVQMVPHDLVRNDSEIMEAMTDYASAGYEGTVIKDPESFYEYKRSKSWLKVKPIKEGDFEITGVKEGKGRLQGLLGALVLDIDGQKCQVGSGFSDKQRKDFWKRRKELPGLIAQVEFQDKTFEEDGVLRFPVFMRLREDK